VQSLTLGYVRDVRLFSGAETGLGLDGTAYRFTSRLDPVYGAHPVSARVSPVAIRFDTMLTGRMKGTNDSNASTRAPGSGLRCESC
jgi:hypothetical protein